MISLECIHNFRLVQELQQKHLSRSTHFAKGKTNNKVSCGKIYLHMSCLGT